MPDSRVDSEDDVEDDGAFAEKAGAATSAAGCVTKNSPAAVSDEAEDEDEAFPDFAGLDADELDDEDGEEHAIMDDDFDGELIASFHCMRRKRIIVKGLTRDQKSSCQAG